MTARLQSPQQSRAEVRQYLPALPCDANDCQRQQVSACREGQLQVEAIVCGCMMSCCSHRTTVRRHRREECFGMSCAQVMAKCFIVTTP